MLSTVTVKAGDRSHEMKLGARAMMAIERETGEGIATALQHLSEDGLAVQKIAKIIGVAMNDGQGAEEDAALDLIDALGLMGAVDLIGKLAEAAFPEAAAEGDDATPLPKPVTGKPSGKKTKPA